MVHFNIGHFWFAQMAKFFIRKQSILKLPSYFSNLYKYLQSVRKELALYNTAIRFTRERTNSLSISFKFTKRMPIPGLVLAPTFFRKGLVHITSPRTSIFLDASGILNWRSIMVPGFIGLLVSIKIPCSLIFVAFSKRKLPSAFQSTFSFMGTRLAERLSFSFAFAFLMTIALPHPFPSRQEFYYGVSA